MIQTIKVFDDRKVSPSRLIVGNQFENGIERIQFELPENMLEKGYRYLILNKPSEDESYPIPLDENNIFYVDSRLTYYLKGVWIANVVLVKDEIKEDNLNPDTLTFISDNITLIIKSNYINNKYLGELPLPENLKIVYDDLLKMYDTIKRDYENGNFNGQDGKSAYEIAVQNGFEGTENEWLASLDYEHSEEFEQLAEQVKNDAKKSASNASTASAAAQSAATNAGAALNSANAASQSAADASVSATQAQQAAQEAENSKTSAETASSNAQQSAQSAEENANKAQEIADSLDPTIFAIKETMQGNPTIISDSAEWRLQKLNIYGQSEQASTNGYQLFDASKLQSSSSSGATVTNNGDGSFTVSGKGNLTDYFRRPYFDYSKEETKKLLKVGTLYGKVELDVFPAVGFLIYSNGEWTELNLIGNIVRSIEITEDMLNADDLYCRIRFYGNNGSLIKTGTIKPMFWQDGNGTWETFTNATPSPSPDYSQEIISKEVSEIKVTGSNLIPSDAIQITQNNIYSGQEKGIYLQKGIKYVYSCTTTGKNPSLYFIKLGEFDAIHRGYNVRTLEFKPTENGLYYLNLYDETGVAQISDLRLNIGEDYGYEPYKEQVVNLTDPITLRGIPVSNGGNITIDGQQYIADVITEKDGVIGVERNNIEIVFDGSEDEVVSVGEYLGNVTRTTIVIENSSYNITFSDKFKFINNYDLDEPHFYYWNNFLYLFVPVQLTNSQQFKEWLQTNPIDVVYTLETPTFEPLPLEVQEQIRALKSYYPNTVIQSGAFNEVTYVADTKTWIENKLNGVTELALGIGGK